MNARWPDAEPDPEWEAEHEAAPHPDPAGHDGDGGDDPDEPTLAMDQALRWLTRREYARRELRRRLRSKGYTANAVDLTMDKLEQNGLQSDQRFCEDYIRSRERRGYGPLRLAAELGERGINREQIGDKLDPDDQRWCEQAATTLRKRFPNPAQTVQERAQQQRFLHNRGFTAGQVRRAMEPDGC